jgi:hypothetical protein
MGNFKAVKFLKALLCFACEQGEMFFDTDMREEYMDCTCAICGNQLFFYNSFRRTSPEMPTISDQLAPYGAGGRMATLNISCEESLPLLKEKRSNT